jgi:hypothetical protein
MINAKEARDVSDQMATLDELVQLVDEKIETRCSKGYIDSYIEIPDRFKRHIPELKRILNRLGYEVHHPTEFVLNLCW